MLPKRSSGLSPLRAACGNRHADEARLLLQQLPCGSRDASWLSGALPFTVIVKWRNCWWREVFQHYEVRDFLIRGNDDRENFLHWHSSRDDVIHWRNS